MTILKIYQDTRAPGRCRSCGAEIEWAELTTGKRMPFDRIVPLRIHAALFGEGRAVVELETDTSPTHFATCPDRDQWRKKR